MTEPARKADRSLIFVAIILILVLYVGWSYVSDVAARNDAMSQSHDVLNRQQDAWNRGDLDGFMADYQMSDDITMYSGGDVRPGWTTIRDRYRKTYQADGAKMGELKFDILRTEVISADATVVGGKWTVVTPEKTSTGLFTLLMRKTREGWKIVHDHTSAAKEK